MLVLSRKVGERIVIGDGITVEVVELRDGKVRLGVVADRQVSVHREEVWQAIHGKQHPNSTKQALDASLEELGHD